MIAIPEFTDDWADRTARLVLADWLQDRDDPRAEGYRALGLGGYATIETWFNGFYYSTPGDSTDLPEDWFDLLEGEVRRSGGHYVKWRDYPDWRSADEAAVLAFSKLPEARRRELLEVPEVV